ncbi:ketopantoate reductase family protein [Heliophilum fasciatum]|uniref:2-dehydropantoate 2-reductase n=1 Tax=Heliophilum fasciatum TaxID=35700 RepID=A0A4R2RV03_9FIRM|nr:2-dehydropantoate 2-reductase [Heliophilum fasciatum]MCW2277154.1 2-dehydropantoate 2-reductase [Heliophilum fasciatum]TCP68210.1 ketopantoate reductase [Heliophilum fasciatum]
MRIAVIGAGAMGSLYAGFLTLAGQDVWVIDTKDTLATRLSETGVMIAEGNDSISLKIQATTCAAEVGPVDLVIILVKAPATKRALASLPPLLADHTVVLSLQNGIGHQELIRNAVGAKRTLVGTTSFGAAVIEPGYIRLSGRGTTLIGELDGTVTPRVTAIAEVFTQAGLHGLVSSDVQQAIWNKLLVNVGINALTALLAVPNGVLLERPELLSLMEKAVQEGQAVALASGVTTDPQIVERTKEIAFRTGANLSSMYQDIKGRRPTEIEMINGAIVAFGQANGVPTPVNQVLTHLVRAFAGKSQAVGILPLR